MCCAGLPPSNDDICSAEVLTYDESQPASFSIDVISATQEEAEAGHSWHFNSVWYTFRSTGPCIDMYTGLAKTNVDTVASLYKLAPGAARPCRGNGLPPDFTALESIEFNDDAFGLSAALLGVRTSASEQYWLQIAGYSGRELQDVGKLGICSAHGASHASTLCFETHISLLGAHLWLL